MAAGPDLGGQVTIAPRIRSDRRMARSSSESTILQHVMENPPADSAVANHMLTNDWTLNPRESRFRRYLIVHAYDESAGDHEIVSLLITMACGTSTCHSSDRPKHLRRIPRLDASLYTCHLRSAISHLEPGGAMMRLCAAVTRAGSGNLEPAGADYALSGTRHKKLYVELSITLQRRPSANYPSSTPIIWQVQRPHYSGVAATSRRRAEDCLSDRHAGRASGG